jgi:hypothetical protein
MKLDDMFADATPREKRGGSGRWRVLEWGRPEGGWHAFATLAKARALAREMVTGYGSTPMIVDARTGLQVERWTRNARGKPVAVEPA